MKTFQQFSEATVGEPFPTMEEECFQIIGQMSREGKTVVEVVDALKEHCSIDAKDAGRFIKDWITKNLK